MNNLPTFEQTSYQSHQNWFDTLYPTDQEKLKLYTEHQQNPIIQWFHKSMYQTLKPFCNPNTQWLTIGDSYGTDATFLETQNVQKVIASDISDAFLKINHQAGFIKHYQKINAEQIELPSNSIDYVLCKEAYHHFPRPYIAVYEMLRVCQEAIVLIEPLDPLLKMPLLMALCNVLDNINPKIVQKIWKNRYSFETVGNFVYKISERECCKLAAAINLPAVAFKGINCNFSGFNKHAVGKTINPKQHQSIIDKLKKGLSVRNFLTRLGIVPAEMLCVVIFKTLPDEQTIEKMKNAGFQYTSLPKNPYLK